jgi:hypothetical protein
MTRSTRYLKNIQHTAHRVDEEGVNMEMKSDGYAQD